MRSHDPRPIGRRELLRGVAVGGAAIAVGGVAIGQAGPAFAEPAFAESAFVESGGAGELPGVRYGWVTSQGVRFRVGQAGPSTGPAILLVHGGLVDHQWWLRQVGPLTAAGYRVVLPDLSGHGASEPCPPLANPYLFDARALADICAALGLHKPLAVGWSLGGARIAVGLGPGGVLEDVLGGVVFTGALLHDTLLNVDLIAAVPLTTTLALRGRDFVRRCAQPAALVPADEDRFTAGSARTSQLEFAQIFATALVTNTGPNIAGSSLKFRVVQGGRDTVVQPHAATQLAGFAGVGVDLFPDDGHAPFYFSADPFNRIVLEAAAGG